MQDKVQCIFQDLTGEEVQLFYQCFQQWPIQCAEYISIVKSLLKLSIHKNICIRIEKSQGVACVSGDVLNLNSSYILEVYKRTSNIELLKKELTGVLIHELVHIYQNNACNTMPWGLIEGIADFIRIKAGYVPPHWKMKPKGGWETKKTWYH